MTTEAEATAGVESGSADSTAGHADHAEDPVIESRETVYDRGFLKVERRLVDVPGHADGPQEREVVMHPPVAVMLVHDVAADRYLLEREYRAGSNTMAYGIPAGFVEDGETPEAAALRELREETGVVPTSHAMTLVGRFYSSEGMTDELASVFLIDLFGYGTGGTDFDPGESIESGWVSFDDMLAAGVVSSNAVIALQAERIRRMGGKVGSVVGDISGAAITV